MAVTELARQEVDAELSRDPYMKQELSSVFTSKSTGFEHTHQNLEQTLEQGIDGASQQERNSSPNVTTPNTPNVMQEELEIHRQ